jgi:hypothetical protein
MSVSFIFKTPKLMQCRYIKHDGSECHANTIEGSEYCWFHAPEVDYARNDAQSKGGKACKTGIYAELSPVKLRCVEDVPELVMDTIRQMRRGFIGPRIAATLGYLSSVLLKSFEVANIDGRLKKLEHKTNEILAVLKESVENGEWSKSNKNK